MRRRLAERQPDEIAPQSSAACFGVGGSGPWRLLEGVTLVYVVKMTDALVDSYRTTTFGHEALQCFGLSHE